MVLTEALQGSFRTAAASSSSHPALFARSTEIMHARTQRRCWSFQTAISYRAKPPWPEQQPYLHKLPSQSPISVWRQKHLLNKGLHSKDLGEDAAFIQQEASHGVGVGGSHRHS
jgi:hypothetical protein